MAGTWYGQNQKRHFRCKVEDCKVQNDVLYHLHTYTETVNGETIKQCKYNATSFTICGFL